MIWENFMKGTKTTIYMSINFGIKKIPGKREVMCQNGKIDNVGTRCTKIWRSLVGNSCISSFSQIFTTMERRILKLVVYNLNYSKTYHLCVLQYKPSLFTVNWRELWHLQMLGRGRSKSNPNRFTLHLKYVQINTVGEGFNSGTFTTYLND